MPEKATDKEKALAKKLAKSQGGIFRRPCKPQYSCNVQGALCVCSRAGALVVNTRK